MAITETDISFLIYQRLKDNDSIWAMVNPRIRPDTIDPNEVMPAIRYEVVRSRPWHSISTEPSETTTQLQIDCYGATRLEANTVAAAVVNNLDGFTGELGEIFVNDCVLDNTYDRVDPPPAGGKNFRKRRTLDFVITHTSPTPTLNQRD
ncbi:DUF3168 domain-containing protein [Rhodopirellula bahusiensis]|uniref:DUF3168 domain-containing protein n=1 Tax=Rhodopirellula bahusiensis TaxID=2014065 RepID=UPI003264AC7D